MDWMMNCWTLGGQHRAPQAALASDPQDVLTAALCQSQHLEDPSKAAEENNLSSPPPHPPTQHVDDKDEDQNWERAVQRLFSCTSPGQPLTSGVTQLRGIRQEETWDCGLACLQIVMTWLEPPVAATDDQHRHWLLSRLQGTQSIWTVDLVLLLEAWLQQEQVDPVPPLLRARWLFCTQRLHVHADWQDLAYYQKAFPQDKTRVEQGFDLLGQRQMPVVQHAHLPWSEVIRLIQREDCIAIALVDNNVLRRGLLPSLPMNEKAPTTPPAPVNDPQAAVSAPSCGEYLGHYIVLAGVEIIDATSMQVVVLNPAAASIGRPERMTKDRPGMINNRGPRIGAPASYVTDGPCYELVPCPCLERAWRAAGTDSDIIFVIKAS